MPSIPSAVGVDRLPRRIVFSRKGFDSGFGGIPSPILPDGRMLALPIPNPHDRTPMEAVGYEDPDLFKALIRDLSGGRHSPETCVHLDPDLDPMCKPRSPGWRPSFGQTGPAQGHLAAKGVGTGDVFLFFGWFREVIRRDGKWCYVRGAPNIHMIFGWLEIGDVLPIAASRIECLQRYPWVAGHPHAENPSHYDSSLNHIYIASEQSRFLPDGPGGGRFRTYSPALRLTASGHSRSVWDVPEWMGPSEGRAPLTYHGDQSRWEPLQSGWRLKTVPKGQEFVCDLRGRSDAIPWLRDLIRTQSSPRQAQTGA